jgi:hypothetical protein
VLASREAANLNHIAPLRSYFERQQPARPHNMGDSQKWGQTRYAVLLAVSGLHVALVITLISVAKVRLRFTSASHPIELLVLPPNASPTISKPAPLLDRAKKADATTVPPPPPALTIVPLDSPTVDAGPAVDWASEAQRVAQERAAKGDPNDRFRSFLKHPQGSRRRRSIPIITPQGKVITTKAEKSSLG